MITIYHNPRCSKSRQALQKLEAANMEVQIVKYLDEVPSEAQLEELLTYLDMDPQELIRKKEATYREQFKGKEFSRKEWIKVLHDNPRLIERPIIVKGKNAVIARPIENMDKFL